MVFNATISRLVGNLPLPFDKVCELLDLSGSVVHRTQYLRSHKLIVRNGMVYAPVSKLKDKMQGLYLMGGASGFGSDLPTGLYHNWDVPRWHPQRDNSGWIAKFRQENWKKWDKVMKLRGEQPCIVPEVHRWFMIKGGSEQQELSKAFMGSMYRYGATELDRRWIYKLGQKVYKGVYGEGYRIRHGFVCPFEIWFTENWMGDEEVLRRPIGDYTVRQLIKEYPESWSRFERQSMQPPEEPMDQLIKERRGFAQLVSYMR